MPLTFAFDTATAENIARLITIVRGTEVIRFTDYGFPLTPISGETFLPEPALMTSMQFQVDGAVSNCDIKINARTDGPLDDSDVVLGRYDGCALTVECCDSADPTAGKGQLFEGVVGSTTCDKARVITITGRGPLTKLRADMSEVYGAMCRADFGDERCGNQKAGVSVPQSSNPCVLADDVKRSTAYIAGQHVRARVSNTGNPTDYANVYYECTTSGTTASSAPSYNASVGATTTDGGAVFTAREAYLRHCQVNTIGSGQVFTLKNLTEGRAIDDWFKLGGAIVRSGRFAGSVIPIRKYTAAGLIVESFVFCSYLIAVDTWLEIHPGCAKTEADCKKFDNIWNRRAEPFSPNRDLVMAQA